MISAEPQYLYLISPPLANKEENMRRSGIIILVIIFVVFGLGAITYLTGNLSGKHSVENTPPVLQNASQNITTVNVGLRTIPDTGQSSRIAFEEAIEQLPNPHSGIVKTIMKPLSNFTIYYFRGRDLDYEGRASTWLFGVRFDNRSALMYYDASGWQSTPWDGGESEKEIVLGSFVPPGDIIRNNAGLISGSDQTQKGLIKDIDLINGRYTVTITRQETQENFVFDAGSGALIQ